MKIVKLDAITSTNSYIKGLMRQGKVENNTVVTALYQTEGRGQMGNRWESERGKNLIFSVFRAIPYLDNDKQFYISIAVALAIYEALKKIPLPGLAIKWPNDILSGNDKVGGILIENSIRNGKIVSTVIGVGLNVNQQQFSALHKGSSLKNITGKSYDLDELLRLVLERLGLYMDMLKEKAYPELKTRYERQLFRIHEMATFRDQNGRSFQGMITGINAKGELLVVWKENQQRAFRLKEITLLY